MDCVDPVRDEGFAIVEDVLDDTSISRFVKLLEDVARVEQNRGGVRNLLDIPEMRELAYSAQVLSLVKPVLGEGAFAVRGILFDKRDGANWKVPWHQDVTIAVKQRVEAEGYVAWSVKQDVLHVQPPSNVLEKMLSVRLHLDDCQVTNGALRVIPKSHLGGKLSQESITKLVREDTVITCAVESGDVLLIRPLVIHASSAAKTPQHRRVIHFDYANVGLAEGLEWREDTALNS